MLARAVRRIVGRLRDERLRRRLQGELDLSLGQHGGLEILQYLRGIGCKAPIIIISGSDQATVHDTLRAAKSLNLDVRETVLKPVDLEMLRYSFERIRTQQHTPAAA